MEQARLPRLPSNSQRIAIVGRTGSGKTQAAVWHLSRKNFTRHPWVIFDFKGDELLNSIEDAQHVDVGTVPRKSGIYIVHPLPNQTEELNEYVWKLWDKKNVGLYVDEGYMMQGVEAFEACLTQGRSRRIPMIVLSQRPAWISRFVFSEADFYQVFGLNDRRDRQTVQSFMPVDLEQSESLKEYHSWYHDVGRNLTVRLAPVPKDTDILAAIEARFEEARGRVKKI